MEFVSNPLFLPIQYNHFLQGMIYEHISDRALRRFLHEHGFSLEKRHFKLFTFSRLEGPFNLHPAEGVIEILSPFRLVLSSIVDEIVRDFCETITKKDSFNLVGQTVYVKGIEVVPTPEFNANQPVRIRMLSPVVMYSTTFRPTPEGPKRYTLYHSPWDEGYSELLYNNLAKKHMVCYGRRPASREFLLVPLYPRDDRQQKVMRFKGTVIKGWMGTYQLQGDPALLRLAYETGLGSKNSLGFGCFEVENETLAPKARRD
ncbi:MAG: CRISPR-associated endoribonuclease Cas6 [Clostridia bacterium]|nr:CRISPR-associated endoribonuclease Cas6 [Clostridia bacterium]